MKYVATSEMVIGGKIVKKGEIIENPSEFKIGLELVIDEQQQLLVEEQVLTEVVEEQVVEEQVVEEQVLTEVSEPVEVEVEVEEQKTTRKKGRGRR